MSRPKRTENEKSLNRTLRYKQNDIDRLQSEIQKLKNEREEFRSHFSSRFHWWVELQGKGETPSTSWLIESDAKWLTKVSSFTW